jgi:thiosulfate/3-mercaptopyruvate sulfurtransferase
MALVTTAWLESQLGRDNLRILDCSVVMRTAPDGTYSFVPGRDDWAAAHVPGSVFVDVMGELAARDDPRPLMMPPLAEFAATMQRFGVGDETDVVLYDRSNHAWAARVWWMLRAAGFDHAAVLDGGWQKWTAEARPASAEVARYPHGRLTLRPRSAAFADKSDVVAALGRADAAIVNALTPDDHRGTAPTRYPRSGRIPGSSNVYCQTLVDPETHAYKTRAELLELFEETGALTAERTICYCGAGIAASSDAFVLTLLGAKDVAVYDGSLAEWAADPSVPMDHG